MQYVTPTKKGKRRRKEQQQQQVPTTYKSAMSKITGLTPELKYLDCGRTLTVLTAPIDCSGGEINPSSGCTGCISAPALGEAFNQRDGSKITMKSILVQGSINVANQNDQTAVDFCPVVTVALVLDKQTNSVTLNSEDVYSNPTGEALQNYSVLRTPSFSKRFKVLKFMTIPLHNPTISYDGTNIEQGGYSIPFTMSKKLNYSVSFRTGETAANVTSVVDNSLHIIAWTNNTGLAPNIGFNSRLRFYG